MHFVDEIDLHSSRNTNYQQMALLLKPKATSHGYIIYPFYSLYVWKYLI